MFTWCKLFIISIVNDENVKCFGHKITEDTDVLHVFRDTLIACLGNNECDLCLCIRSQEIYPQGVQVLLLLGEILHF